MPWFKVDDKFHSHRKVMLLGKRDFAAISLWTVAGSWCADHLTDGFIPDYVAQSFDSQCERHANALVRVGLWEVSQRNGDSGWSFHGWNDPGRQPTASQVQTARESNAARQKRFRDTHNGVTDAVTETSEETSNAVTDPLVTAPHTYIHTYNQTNNQTEPQSKTPPAASPRVGKSASPDRFDEFWNIYPRREAKAAARKAWTSAIKRGDTDKILAAAASYRDDPRRQRADPKFTPHPATWLNQDRWDDEPLAAYVPHQTGGNDSHLSAAMARAQAAEEDHPRLPWLEIGS